MSRHPNFLITILCLLCPLLFQRVLTSCKSHRTLTSTTSQVSSTEIFRALAAHSAIDFVDTIIFTPATSPTEAQQKPHTTSYQALPFIIQRHAHLTHHAHATDTTTRQSSTETADTTSCHAYSCPSFHKSIYSVRFLFICVLAIFVVTMLIYKIMKVHVSKRLQ